MFILEAAKIPSTTAELTDAITASLQKSIQLPPGGSPVQIVGELPQLTSLTVDVSGGQVVEKPPLPDPAPPVDQTPGPTTAAFNILGNPVSAMGLSLLLRLSASDVSFNYGRYSAGSLVVTPHEAADGQLLVQLTQAQLESGMLAIAQRAAAAHGVAITKVNATLTSISPTELDVLLNVTAKKFVTAVIRISGRLKINDQMVATATDLNARGDGMVGHLAVGFLQPHLQKLNGTPLPLLAFSLGNIGLHGIRVETGNGLKITATFGSRAT